MLQLVQSVQKYATRNVICGLAEPGWSDFICVENRWGITQAVEKKAKKANTQKYM